MNLVFQGYWRDENASSVPDRPGIYCVYRGTFDGVYVHPEKVIYIGESSNARLRIAEHDKEVLKSHLKSGQILMYTFAQTNTTSEENSTSQIERRLYWSQLIYANEPPANANIPVKDPGVSLELLGYNQQLISHKLKLRERETNDDQSNITKICTN